MGFLKLYTRKKERKKWSYFKLLSKLLCLFLCIKVSLIDGAVGRVVRSDAGDHGYKPWMVFIFLKCVNNTKIVRN